MDANMRKLSLAMGGMLIPLVILALLGWGLSYGQPADAAKLMSSVDQSQPVSARPHLAEDNLSSRMQAADGTMPGSQAAAYLSFSASSFNYQDLWLPFVAKGYDGWHAAVVVQNIGSVVTTRIVQFYDLTGTMVLSRLIVLPPLASSTLALDAFDDLPDGFVGAMVFRSGVLGQELAVVARLVNSGLPGDGMMMYEAYHDTNDDVYTPGVYYERDGLNSAIVLVNAWPAPASYDIELIDANGAVVYSTSYALAAHQPKILALSELSHTLPASGFVGTVVVRPPVINGRTVAMAYTESSADGRASAMHGSHLTASGHLYLPNATYQPDGPFSQYWLYATSPTSLINSYYGQSGMPDTEPDSLGTSAAGRPGFHPRGAHRARARPQS